LLNNFQATAWLLEKNQLNTRSFCVYSTVPLQALIYDTKHYPTTKQAAYDAANKHIKNDHSPEQETDSVNKTLKLITCSAASQQRSKKNRRQ
jgi:hypothetical protein